MYLPTYLLYVCVCVCVCVRVCVSQNVSGAENPALWGCILPIPEALPFYSANERLYIAVRNSALLGLGIIVLSVHPSCRFFHACVHIIIIFSTVYDSWYGVNIGLQF